LDEKELDKRIEEYREKCIREVMEKEGLSREEAEEKVDALY
jgi:hypothetical protein